MIYFFNLFTFGSKIIYDIFFFLFPPTFDRHPIYFHTYFFHHDYLVTVVYQVIFILILLNSLVSEYSSY